MRLGMTKRRRRDAHPTDHLARDSHATRSGRHDSPPIAGHGDGGAGKPLARLEQWRLIRVAEGSRHLVGIASGHPRQREGARIISSAVIHLARDRSRAETLNTIYLLGAPGHGPLPPKWAERVDHFLLHAWGTFRIGRGDRRASGAKARSGAPGSTTEEHDVPQVYARIAGWAFVQLREPGRPFTMHLVGYLIAHDRLVGPVGEAYIGSALREINLGRGTCHNGRGKLIALVGDPLPPGPLPEDLREMLRQAEELWQVQAGTTWERAELTALAALAEASQSRESGGDA
jgi:hypothetical protein